MTCEQAKWLRSVTLRQYRLLVCSAEELILLAQFQGSCDVDRIHFSGIWVIFQQAGRQRVAVLQPLHGVSSGLKLLRCAHPAG